MSTTRALALFCTPDGVVGFVCHVEDRKGELVCEFGRSTITRGRTHDAWLRLAAVRVLDEFACNDVALLLRTTVVDPAADRPTLPKLDIGPPAEPRKATAAHPRAYQGTKHQPPKSRQTSPAQLRLYLTSDDGRDRLVAVCRDASPESMGGLEIVRSDRSQPTGFREQFAWCLRDDSDLQARVLAIYHRLGLEQDATSRAVVACLVREPHGPYTFEWLELLPQVDPGLQTSLLRALWLHAEAADVAPPVGATITSLWNNCVGDYATQRIDYVLRCLIGGWDLEAALEGFHLAELHRPEWSFGDNEAQTEKTGRPPSAEGREAIRRFLAAHVFEPSWLAMHLWSVVDADVALAPLLDRLANSKLEASVAVRIAETLMSAVTDEDLITDFPCEQLDSLMRFLSVLEQLAPEYRMKAVDLLREHVFSTSLATLERSMELLPIVYAPPFLVESRVSEPLASLAVGAAEMPAALAQLPIASLRKLENSCRRANETRLLDLGLHAWVQEDATFVLDALASHPGSLLQATKVLGLLSRTQRLEVLDDAGSGPLCLDPGSLDAPQLVALCDEHAAPRSSPVPKRLRQFVEGELELSSAQVERATAKVVEAWPGVLCDRVHDDVLHRIQRSLGVDELDVPEFSDQMLHAFKMQQWMDEPQRRSLRRLIRACLASDTEFLDRHPANTSWFARTPSVSRKTWLGANPRSDAHPKHGEITITMERDPLEALRLGTHVGSCLGLGGSFAYSATAVVLDANKQVAFARDMNGTFLARQVLAIAPNGRLCCFGVYPEPDASLKQSFVDYGEFIAQSMGLQITEDEDDADAVELLVAREWWNDGLETWRGSDDRLQSKRS